MQTVEYALTTGTLLDNRYKIESILGEGGFGITYKAHDQDLDYTVVIKEFLPQEFAARAADTVTVQARTNRANDYEYGLTSFIEEARTLAKFQHPNIVRVSNFLKANGTAYFVMDYAAGIALDEWLKTQVGALSEDTILNIITPILTGLAEVHKAGLMHRDIKPGNIYLRNEGGPMLIDFGAARMALGEHSKSISAIISMGYAPPEQYTTRGVQGSYTDLYAVGAVLYKLITGETPIESPDRSHAKAEEETDPLIPATEAGKGKVSNWLLKICDQLLAVSPKQRPQSAEAVLVAIKNKEPVNLKDKTVKNNEVDTGTRVVTDEQRFDEEPSAVVKKIKTVSAPKNTKKLSRIAAGLVIAGVVVAAVMIYMNRTYELEIDSLPQGASISLDGKYLGLTTPAKIAGVVPGYHEVTLSKSGYEKIKTEVYDLDEDHKIQQGLTNYHRSIVKADSTEHLKAKQGEIFECVYPDAIDYKAPSWVCGDSVAGLVMQSVGSGKYIEPSGGVDEVTKQDRAYRNYLEGPVKAYQSAVVALERDMQVEVSNLVKKYVETGGSSAEQADAVLSDIQRSVSTFKSKSGKVSYQGMLKTYTETSGEGKDQVKNVLNTIVEKLIFNAGEGKCRIRLNNFVNVTGSDDAVPDRSEEYVAKDGDNDISGCEFSAVVKDLDESGYKLVNMIKSPAGTYYALVGFTEEMANSKTKQTLKESMANEKALWKQFKDKQAQQELADEIANQ